MLTETTLEAMAFLLIGKKTYQQGPQGLLQTDPAAGRGEEIGSKGGDAKLGYGSLDPEVKLPLYRNFEHVAEQRYSEGTRSRMRRKKTRRRGRNLLLRRDVKFRNLSPETKEFDGAMR